MADKDIRFTPDRLRDLPLPATGRATYRDTEVKGLELRVAASGVKTFSVYRWVPATHRPERVTLGRFTGKAGGLTIDSARKQAIAILNAINEYKSPALERAKYHASDTFQQAFDKWMDNHVRVHLKDKSAQDFQTLFDLHIKPSRLHVKKLVDIEHTDIEALSNRIGQKRGDAKGKPFTANKTTGLIRAVYRHTAKHVKGLAIPTVGLTKFETGSRARILESHEMPRFDAALEETAQPYRDIFRMLQLTGSRLNNMLSATRDQFDLVNAQWTIPGSQYKTKKPHTMALDKEAVEIVTRRLAALPEGCDWLWPCEGKRSSDSGHIEHVGEPWADLLERAKIKNLRRHDLRRTLGSNMAMNGVGLPIIGEQLGHSAPASTQVYARMAKDSARPALVSTIAKMNQAAKRKA